MLGEVDREIRPRLRGQRGRALRTVARVRDRAAGAIRVPRRSAFLLAPPPVPTALMERPAPARGRSGAVWSLAWRTCRASPLCVCTKRYGWRIQLRVGPWNSKKAYAVHIGQNRSHRERSYREILLLFSVFFLILNESVYILINSYGP